MLRFKGRVVLAFVAALSVAPVFAQGANFESLTYSGGERSVVTGYTRGSYSLSAIANTDNKGNPCIGYGAPTPDHILTLKKDFSQLRVQINSKGKDTTLVIQGPSKVVRCGDDTGSGKDASVEDTNWKAGNYSMWVGSVEAGQRVDYSLSVQ